MPASNCDTWTALFPSREPCRCKLELACSAGARRCPNALHTLIMSGLGRHSASVHPRSSGGRVLLRPAPLCAQPAGPRGRESQPARGPEPGAVSTSQDVILLPAFVFERGRRNFRAERFLTLLLTRMPPFLGNPVPAMARVQVFGEGLPAACTGTLTVRSGFAVHNCKVSRDVFWKAAAWIAKWMARPVRGPS